MLEMIDVKFQHNFRYPPGNESIFPPKGVSLKIMIDSKMPAWGEDMGLVPRWVVVLRSAVIATLVWELGGCDPMRLCVSVF